MVFTIRLEFNQSSMKKIKFIIFDMDGVLWKGETPLSDLRELFSTLDKAGIQYAFATNNSTKSPQEYQDKLANFHVNVEENQIITSGISIVHRMKEDFPDRCRVYAIGENGLLHELEKQGFIVADDDIQAVVGGLDREINYNKLTKATLHINHGANFYFSNGDTTFPTPEGNVPGAGSILAALEAATNIKAISIGKPNPYMFLELLRTFNYSAEETLIIGDRLDTDILGGFRAGCHTALVLTGVSNQDDFEKSDFKPDLVEKDIQTLINNIKNKNWEL